MNLKDKLARLDRSQSLNSHASIPDIETEDWVYQFQQELDAKILSEKNSFVIVKENYRPVYNNIAFIRLREAGFRLKNIQKLTDEPNLQNLNLRNWLFVDTETTGLAGGTGTFAFLVGIGHIELDHIVVRQYLLPDFQHEWLLLKQLENCFTGKEGLVSFNGKTFDIPLMKSRFVLNRLDSVLEDMQQMDLLHISRRIWRSRLESCTLQNLEYHILGEKRLGDIPGEMIPQVYFQFIRKRKAILLRDVLEHNFHDIANLILLTMEIEHILEDPVDGLKHPEDVLSIATYFYKKKDFDEALTLLEHLREWNQAAPLRNRATYLLSMTHKKKGAFQEAKLLMEELLSGGSSNTETIEELAKHYEHRDKDYGAALEIVEQGLMWVEMMQKLERGPDLGQLRERLQHRQRRLQKKMQKNLR